MKGVQAINTIVTDRLQGVAPDICSALATRAVLRVLPLLVCCSETPLNLPFEQGSFGFWSPERKKGYSMTLMRSLGLNIFLAHGNFPSARLFSNDQSLIDGMSRLLERLSACPYVLAGVTGVDHRIKSAAIKKQKLPVLRSAGSSGHTFLFKNK